MRAKSRKVGLLSTPSLSTRVLAMATLGISTNTRLLGYAIINQDRLEDYSIRLFKSPWSPSKATQIITSLEPCVRRYSITKVVLSIPREHHQTKAFRDLRIQLKQHFESYGIAFHTKHIRTVVPHAPKDKRKSKRALLDFIVQKYPELQYCYLRELRNKKRYYIKVFEAVAVASLAAQDQ